VPDGAAVLERVPLLERDVDDYVDIIGRDAVARLRELAEPFRGARVLHVNATPYGGGVAELLATHVPLLRSLGITADWAVIRGTDQFFHVTKAVHNALQGADIEYTSEMQRVYLDLLIENAAQVEDGWDFVVAHDPQPAGLLKFVREGIGSAQSAATKWIWRCHIDLTDADPEVWEFFRPLVELHDVSVWTMDEFVPANLAADSVVVMAPSIDPLSVKNLDLPQPFSRELCKQYGIDPSRPILCQVSRFDPWKDPVGVIRAYNVVRERVTDSQLVLAGSMATDDPEGYHVWEEVEAERAGNRDIHLLSNIHQVGNVQINAFQREADVVLQKSVREGFGLTVSEGLWKARPVVGGRAGGIKLQIRDGFDGYLVDSVEECAARTLDLLADPVGADAMGAQGREHVRDNFLCTRELEEWLQLFAKLRS